jgi:hypothetical protein
MTTASALTKPAQIRLARRSPAYWRVTIDNPPINVMGPEMVQPRSHLPSGWPSSWVSPQSPALTQSGSKRPTARN